MPRNKYLWLIVGFVISVGTFVTIVILAELQAKPGSMRFIPPEYVSYFVEFLPGPLFTDLIVLYAIPIGLVLLFFGIGVIIVTGLIKVHAIAHRGAKFGISFLGSKVSGMKLFKRALFVGLFAFSITSLIVNAGYGALFRNTSITRSSTTSYLFLGEATFIGTFFIVGILIFLLLPFWLMEDVGVLIYDIRPETRETPTIGGIHMWYVDFFKGYAGISAIITLVNLIVGTLSETTWTQPAILTPLILIVLPFITSGLLTIPMVMYEKLLPKMVEKLQKRLDATRYPEINIPVHDQVLAARS